MNRNLVAKCRAGVLIVFIFNTVLLLEHVIVLKQEKQTDNTNGLAVQSIEPVDTPQGRASNKHRLQLIQKDILANVSAKVIFDANVKKHKLSSDKGSASNVVNNDADSVQKLRNVNYPSYKNHAEKQNQSRTNVTFIQIDKTGPVNRTKLMEAANKTISSTLSPVELERLQQIFYQKKDKMVNKFAHNFVILPPRDICSGSVFMLALVHSKPEYHERRDAIRRTWGNLTNSDNKWGQEVYRRKLALIFLIGRSPKTKLNGYIEMESFYNGDILVGDFQDSYRNMTLKSLLGLKYASEYCRHVPYLLKSDDDMFIHIPQLTKILDNSTLERSIMGPYNYMSKVYRRGKWSISYQEFPFPFFPPYESGSAYVITMDIVPELYDTSHYVPWMFIDDVYITGILGKIINVTHVQTSGLFAYWNDKTPQYCDIVLNRKIAMTKCTPKVLHSLWGYVFHGQFYVESCNEKILHEQKLEEQRAKKKKVPTATLR